MKVFGKNGVFLGVRRSEAEETAFPIPEGSDVVEFDSATNVSTVQNIWNDWSSFDFVGGVFRYKEVPVVFQPDSPEATAAKAQAQDKTALVKAQVDAILVKIAARKVQMANRQTAISADIALLPTATAAQQRAIIGRMLNGESDSLLAEDEVLDVLKKIIKIEQWRS